MIRNYIKIAFRTLLKNKGYSFLNIFGLAIGITCASLIFLWVEDEANFDSFSDKQDYVYYVPTNQEYEGEWRTFNSTPGPLAKALKDEVPGIIKASRSKIGTLLFTVGDNGINRQGRYADQDFLDIMDLKFIEGNAKSGLKIPNAIVITQETAEELYGLNTKVVGKILRVNNKDNYVITGVIKNLPNNVTYPFSWLVPFEKFINGREWMYEYGSNYADTFVELSPEANFEVVDAQVRQLLQKKTEEDETYAFLHSMNDWHLRDSFKDGVQTGGQIVYVRLFVIIALIILLIACINFMNLSTARSEKRANEVGVRKAMGSGKSRLMIQFISEALILSYMATLLSVLLLYVLLPEFNLLIGKNLILSLNEPLHLIALLSIASFCGILAGTYPAFYLSSFKPVEVLKGIKVTQGSVIFIRKGLVVGQFVTSIIFIVSTLLVYQQIQHVKSRDLGYDKNQLISMDVNGSIVEKFSVIKEDLIATGTIENIGLNNSSILSAGNNGSGFQWEGGTDTEDILISFREVSADFFDTAGMTLLKGRGFSENVSQDSTNVLVSESLAKLMGDDGVIGKKITWGRTYTVVGVVNDYLYGDMYIDSDPVIYINYQGDASYLYLKAKSGIPTDEMLSKVETVMKRHNPGYPFQYTFVDESFNAKFKSEQLIGKLSQIFALLAILISCLGLFGLAAYTAEQRRKEIGIRKVLGASISTIVKLLSRDFLKLVGLSIVIAIPIAWFLMNNWLQDFAYRIEIKAWVFIIAGIVAIMIALFTVSFQALKAAIANPIKSLRTE